MKRLSSILLSIFLIICGVGTFAQASTLRFKVVDTEQKGISGVKIYYVGDGQDNRGEVTSYLGIAEITGLKPGHYLVKAHKPGYRHITSSVDLVNVADVILRMVKLTVSEMIEALTDKEMILRLDAAQALGEIGDERAVPALTKALSDEAISVRKEAAFALGEIGEPAKEAVPALIKALSDDFKEVRGNAAFALGKMSKNAAAAVLPLIQKLGDRDGFVRVNASLALYRIDKSQIDIVIPALVEALGDEDKEVSRNAVKALQQIGIPEAKKALKEFEKNN